MVAVRMATVTALLTIAVLIAAVTFAVGSASGSGTETDRLWGPLLPIALVMGSFGAAVLVLSLLSPTLTGAVAASRRRG